MVGWASCEAHDTRQYLLALPAGPLYRFVKHSHINQIDSTAVMQELLLSVAVCLYVGLM